MSGVNVAVDSNDFSVVCTSVKSIVAFSKVDPAIVLVDDCAVVGSSVTPVVDGSVSSVESSSDESSVNAVGLFVTLVDISDVNGVVNSSSVVESVTFTVVSSKVDTTIVLVDDCAVVGSSVTPVVDGSVSSVETSSDESSVNAVGLFVTLVDISDVNGVVNSSSVTFTVVSSKVDTAIALVDDCAVVGSSVTPVVDGSVSSVESSSDESSVNAVGLFVTLVDISDVNDVVNSSSVVESMKSTVVLSKVDTAVIPVVGCVVVGSTVTPVVDGSVSSVESSSDESSVNAVGLFVTLVDISDVNGVVNSSSVVESVTFTVVSSKVDTATIIVDDCAVVGSSVTPVVDGSVSSVESSSDESSVIVVGLFVTLVDISDVNGVVNSSSVRFTVVSSKVDTAIALVDDCAVVGSSVTPVVDGSVSSVESSSDESSVNAVGLFVTLVDISDVNGVVNSSSVTFTVVSSKVDTAIIIVDDCAVVGSSVTPVVDGSVSSVESSSDESSVNAVGLFVALVDISDVNDVVNSSSVVESMKSTVVLSKVDTAVIPVVGCVVVGSSVTPVVDGSVSSVESSSDESSVNAVGLFVTLVDISDVNGVVNSSSVRFTVVSSKVDTAIALVDDCAVVGSSVNPVVDGSVSSVESSSDESSVNAVGLFVTLVDISDVNGVVNSSSVVESVTFTVVSSKVDTAIVLVDDCAVDGSSVTPVVDGSVSSVETSSDESSVNAVGLFVTLVDISDVNGVVNSSSVVESVTFTVVSSKVDTAIVLVDDCAVVGSSVTPVVDGSVSSVETSSDESSVNAVGLFVTLVDISDVNGVVNSSSVVESVTFTVVSSKVDTATIIVDDCAVVGSSVTPVVDGSVSSVESSSDESSVVVVGLFVTLVDISDVNGVVNSSSVKFTVVSSKVDTATIIVDDCVVVGSSVTPVVDGSVSSVESSSDESSVNAVGLFVTLVDISDVNGVVNSSSVTFTVVSSKVDTAIALVDDCAVVGSSVTPVVDGSVSSVESSSEESSVNAVGLFVALVDISDVNDVVNSSSVVESVKSTVVSSKLDTAVIPVVGCVVVGSSVTTVVDGSVSSVESSSDESSVNAVGLFVTLVDISDVNGVVNSSSVRFTVVSSKVDTAIALVDDCAVVGSSVTPVVDGSVSSVESSSDESSVNAVGLFVALVDISDVNDAVNSSSVVESMKSTVVSSKLDTAVIPVVGCVVVGSSVTPVVDGSVSSVESSSDESSVNAVGLFVTLVDISDVNGVVNSSSVRFTVVSSKVDTAIVLVDDCAVVGSSVTPVVDGSVSSVESSSDESSVNAVGLFVTLVDISDVNGVVNSSSVVESVKSTVVSSKLDTAVNPVVGCVVVGSSVTPVVDGSVSSVESSSDESSVNAVGLFVTLVDISDVNGVVNSSSVVESVKSTVVSSKLDTAVIPVVGCVVVD